MEDPNSIYKERNLLIENHGLFPKEQKGCCKGTSHKQATKKKPTHSKGGKDKKKNIAIAWIDKKKRQIPRNIDNRKC